MFEHIKIKPKQALITRCTDFIKLYERWVSAVAWFSQMRQKGKDSRYMRPQFTKLERTVDSQWSCLTEKEKDDVTEELINKGFLPVTIRPVKKAFDGTVIDLKAERVGYRCIKES